MLIFGRVYASCDVGRTRRVHALPVLGEASGENVRYLVGNIIAGLQGSQMVIPEITWDDGWNAVCGFVSKVSGRVFFRGHRP